MAHSTRGHCVTHPHLESPWQDAFQEKRVIDHDELAALATKFATGPTFLPEYLSQQGSFALEHIPPVTKALKRSRQPCETFAKVSTNCNGCAHARALVEPPWPHCKKRRLCDAIDISLTDPLPHRKVSEYEEWTRNIQEGYLRARIWIDQI